MSFLLDHAIQVTLLMGVALAVTPFLRTRSAALRHAVLAAAFLSAFTVLVIGAMTPWEWSLTMADGPPATAGDSPALEPEPRSDGRESVVPAGEPTPVPSAGFLVDPWLLLMSVWLAGTGIHFGVLSIGLVRLRRIARAAIPLDLPMWSRARREIARRYGLRQPILLLESRRTPVLVTWGVFRPKIVVPAGAANWDETRVLMVLGHELAHIRRGDWWIQIVAEVLRSIHWLNPFVWIACRRLRLAGEQAADDAVLGLGFPASEYADHLLDLARNLISSGRIASLALAMARRPALERRIAVMLNSRIPHVGNTRVTVGTIAAIALVLVLPIAGLRAAAEAEREIEVAPTRAAALPEAAAPTPGEASPAEPRPEVVRPVPPQEALPGSVHGVVFDPTGARIPGAWIELQSAAAPIGRVSSEVGEFSIPGLRPGEYTLIAELPGFRTLREDIVIAEGQQLIRDVFLGVGQVSTALEIVSDRLTEAPTEETPRPPRYRVTAGVQSGNLISRVQPVYPPHLRAAGIEGTVVLEGMISSTGVIEGLNVVSSDHVDLAVAARQAVRQWRYQPTVLNNEPVAVATRISVRFALND